MRYKHLTTLKLFCHSELHTRCGVCKGLKARGLCFWLLPALAFAVVRFALLVLRKFSASIQSSTGAAPCNPAPAGRIARRLHRRSF